MSQQLVDTTEQPQDALIHVDSLDVEFSVSDGTVRALRDVSMTLEPGETLGVVGESGSGKSTLALAIMRYLDNNASIPNGSINYRGRDIYDLSSDELRSIRGNKIAHVAQNASRSLNPSLRIGTQIQEAIEIHQGVTGEEAEARVHEVLDQVNIPNPPGFATRYPFELSGGQQQRALIAIGLSCDPECLILDEPTTGLDVTTQAKLLDLIEDLKADSNVGIMLITHNLAVVSQIAETVNILYAGKMMEKGPVDEVFTNPANPYTQALLATTPELGRHKELRPIPGQIPELSDIPDGCIFADRCDFVEEQCRSGSIPLAEVSDGHGTRCLRHEATRAEPIVADDKQPRESDPGEIILEADGVVKHYDTGTFFQRKFRDHQPVKAVQEVDLAVAEGETLGLVGESGCGKSTLGWTFLGLLDINGGSIKYRGNDIDELSKSERREFRSECQILFQDPYGSLNPRKRIKEVIERPLKLFTDMDEEERDARISELLEQVNLAQDLKEQHPHELSGGQQQRVAIARAFATHPSLVVLDEPVSSLDVSVQASILNLLDELQEEYNTSYLLISHDIGVIEEVSDRLAVMYLGEIVERGPIQEVLTPPMHPYTRSLLSSIPSLDPHVEEPRLRLEGDVPNARSPPSGCSFHTRCPQKIGEVCTTDDPELTALDGSQDEQAHCISCHLDESDMAHSIGTPIEEL